MEPRGPPPAELLERHQRLCWDEIGARLDFPLLRSDSPAPFSLPGGPSMNEPVLIVTLIVLAVLELFWILGQRRQVSRYRALSRSIRKEKEAAITLMDRIGERLTRSVDLDETLEVIAKYVVKATAAESGAVYLCHDAGDNLEARVVSGQLGAMTSAPHPAKNVAADPSGAPPRSPSLCLVGTKR